MIAGGYGTSFWSKRSILKLDGGDGCTICEYTTEW